MAKTKTNTALKKFKGKVDGWVYRRREGQTIVSAVPDMSEVVPTELQRRVRERFGKAADYGEAVIADPARREPYERAAEGTLANAFSLAVGDYMQPPTVRELDLTAYNGHVGDLITITADDDFEVVAVKVTLKNAAGDVIEQGQAAPVEGFWRYHGTTDVPRDQNILIEAEASDRPNNARALSDTWHA